MRTFDSERIHHRKGVGDQRVEAVTTFRRLAMSVPALIIAKHAIGAAEVGRLRVPHRKIGGEGIAEDEPSCFGRTFNLAMNGDAVGFDVHGSRHCVCHSELVLIVSHIFIRPLAILRSVR